MILGVMGVEGLLLDMALMAGAVIALLIGAGVLLARLLRR